MKGDGPLTTRHRRMICAAAFMASTTAIFSGAVHAPDLPAIRVLATAGTIAGAQASATGYGYKSGAYDVNSLIKAVPNLEKLATITGEQVATEEPAEESSGPQIQQIMPRLYGKVIPILAIALGILALGFVLLYRSNHERGRS